MKKKKKKKKTENRILNVNDWIVNSAECYTNYHSYSGLRLRVSIWCYVCYTQCQTKRKNKKRKDNKIYRRREKGVGGRFVDRGHETGGRILKVVVSLRRTFARDQILREKQRPRRSERPRSCCCESTFREQNPATIRDRDRANICIYTEW